jgi:hypothetical protein
MNRIMYMNEETVVSPFPKRGVLPKIRAMEVNELITFPVGSNEWTIRSTAYQVGVRLDRKYQTHRYEDGSIGVWREK